MARAAATPVARSVARYLIVGSGATGVHAARTLLDRGASVAMVDVGFERPGVPLPDADFTALKEQHDNPERYLLGATGEAVVYPAPSAKPYGFPPSKAYVFRRPDGVRIQERGFSPLLSFARGGLAEAWTGGSYELRDEELADFPFAAAALRPHYATVAHRIGITAAADDLQRFSPLTSPYLEPLPMDAHSAALHARYDARRDALNASGVYLGRSRVAVLSRDLGARRACGELGRCLWGCPRGALYAPSLTLTELLTHPQFSYHPGWLVRRVLLDRATPGGEPCAIGVEAVPVAGGGAVEFRADRVILAAGALATTQVYLETLAAMGRADVALPGLMDNRHVMIPFVSLGRLGADVTLASYQFHMLAMGLDTGNWRTDVHGQVSTLKAASVHPIVHSLPFDLRTSLRVFRRLRAALGVANIWLPDTRREGNVARLRRMSDGTSQLLLEYGDEDHDLVATREAIDRTRRALGALGCMAPKGMVKVLPRGSSVHYAGTIPMREADDEHTTRHDGSVRGVSGLFIVDGAGFPWLPAKNLTFTLMANATRIAELLD
ncbi:MAG: GMC family oxidoreductase [Gemmatimonadaceae bacterium]|nr:GMC family oxidoreductase [Gemmatimonadaceae bacterium]